MPTRDERKKVQDQFDDTKTRQPTTLRDIWNNSRVGQAVNDVVSTTLNVLRDIPGEVFNIVKDTVQEIEDERQEFTTGKWVERIIDQLRESGYEDQAVLLSEKLANNPEIAEEKLTMEDLREMGIDMSQGRTEMAGEPERETGEPQFRLGQNQTPEFQYDSLGETDETTDRTEQTTRDMYGLDELQAKAEPGSGAEFQPMSTETADLKGPPDPDVQKVQGALEQLGMDLGPEGVDGYYGTDTAAAVTQFQKQYNEMTGEAIEVDGVVDPETLTAMQRAIQEGLRF